MKTFSRRPDRDAFSRRCLGLLLFVFLPVLNDSLKAQTLSLEGIVNPSTIVTKEGKPVTFAIHGFIEFKSLADAFFYIESQRQRWPGKLDEAARQQLARYLLHHAIESRIVSMADERPLELLLTHTSEEVKQAIARVKEPTPAGYTEAFLAVQEKWKHSLNCWSASPSIAGRVLSNWYPIDEGIELYGATYDSTEHFWQAVKYHPDVTVADLTDLLARFKQTNWSPWLARLDDDPKLYLSNAYAIEFLRHNLTPERLEWFRDQLKTHGLRSEESARRAQQRGAARFRFTAYEEKVIWGDLADLFHLVYVFSSADDPMPGALAKQHFDGIYLPNKSAPFGSQKVGFISPEFRSQMLEVWKVKYLQMPRFREVITSIPREIKLEHFLNDGDSPDIPIPVYIEYLNKIRELAIAAGRK
jgi:hypothetical protein